MKKSRKFFNLATAAFAFLFSCINGFNAKSVDALSPIVVNGVQLRGDQNADEYYFVINSDSYHNVVVKDQDITGFNTLDKVHFYLSDTSGSVTLKDIATGYCVQNKWSSDGVMFQIKTSSFQIYNGATVYKVVIDEGCELSLNNVKFETNEKYIYINPAYGQEDAKCSAFWWDRYFPKDPIEADITGVQIRGNANDDLYYLVVNDSSLDKLPVEYSFKNFSDYNALDKIKVYLTEKGIANSLRSIVANAPWYVNRWGSHGVMFPLSKDTYDIFNGSTVFKIELLEGLTMPSVNGTLTLDETLKFSNDNYLNEKNKYESFNWSPFEDYLEDDSSFIGIQFRGDVTARECYFVIVDDHYKDVEAGSPTYNKILFNVLDNITIYVSSEDTVGVKLRNIVSEEVPWIQNKWSSSGIMFTIPYSTFEIYNGSSVYAVKIDAGTNYPCMHTRLTIQNEITLYNLSYQDSLKKFEAFEWSLDVPHDPIDLFGNITGVQVRSAASNENYIVIQAPEFVDVNSETKIFDLSKYDFADKIHIYMNKEDEVGITLGEIFTTGIIRQNRWECSGAMFTITDELYEQYNGSTIYKIIIDEGCIIPCGLDLLHVNKSVCYVNNDYQNVDAINEAFRFVEKPITLQNFGTFDITLVQDRADVALENRWIMISTNFEFDTEIDVSGIVEDVNFVNAIEFYETDNSQPIKLSEIYVDIAKNRQFNEVNVFGFQINPDVKYSGSNIFKIKFLKGLQLPAYKNGEAGYITLEEDIIFINNDFGKSGNIIGEYDEFGLPRTYENWSVDWRRAYLISFVVEGLDKQFDSIYISNGNYFDLSSYEVNGYKLSIVTQNGDRVYQGLTINGEDLVLTLTYSRSGGCKGDISTMNIFALLTLLLIPTIVLVKKGGKSHA